MIYQAIETKYMGPTNTKGARIKATTAAGTFVMDWDYELNPADNHINAAKLCADKFEWSYTTLHTGATNNGYCHVLVRS